MNEVVKAKQLIADIFSNPLYDKTNVINTSLEFFEEDKTSKCYYIRKIHHCAERVIVVGNFTTNRHLYNKNCHRLLSFTTSLFFEEEKNAIELPNDFISSILELINFL